MKTIFLISAALIIISTSYDYSLTLAYYSIPAQKMEWSISILREGDTAYIDIVNFKARTFKKSISKKVYIKLINRMNKRGIWRLKDIYRENSPNGFYLIKVCTRRYSNSFRVEHGVPLTGKKSRYREIIRHLINMARLYIRE